MATDAADNTLIGHGCFGKHIQYARAQDRLRRSETIDTMKLDIAGFAISHGGMLVVSGSIIQSIDWDVDSEADSLNILQLHTTHNMPYLTLGQYVHTLPQTISILKQILTALAFMHDQLGVVHGNLRPCTIWLFESQPGNAEEQKQAKEKWIVKLMPPEQLHLREVTRPAVVPTTEPAVWFTAPEYLLGGTLDRKANVESSQAYHAAGDIWAVAVTMIHTVLGHGTCALGQRLKGSLPPFQQPDPAALMQDIWSLVGQPTESTWPGVTSTRNWTIARKPDGRRKLLDLISHSLGPRGSHLIMTCMMALNPSKRFTAAAALKHPVFATAATVPPIVAAKVMASSCRAAVTTINLQVGPPLEATTVRLPSPLRIEMLTDLLCWSYTNFVQDETTRRVQHPLVLLLTAELWSQYTTQTPVPSEDRALPLLKAMISLAWSLLFSVPLVMHAAGNSDLFQLQCIIIDSLHKTKVGHQLLTNRKQTWLPRWSAYNSSSTSILIALLDSMLAFQASVANYHEYRVELCDSVMSRLGKHPRQHGMPTLEPAVANSELKGAIIENCMSIWTRLICKLTIHGDTEVLAVDFSSALSVNLLQCLAELYQSHRSCVKEEHQLISIWHDAMVDDDDALS